MSPMGTTTGAYRQDGVHNAKWYGNKPAEEHDLECVLFYGMHDGLEHFVAAEATLNKVAKEPPTEPKA